MLLVLAMLLVHDIWYSQLVEEHGAFKLRDEIEPDSNEHSRAFSVLLITELSILALFVVDIVIHALAYGQLFLKHLVPVLEALLIVVNVAILIIMADEKKIGLERNNLFGCKILFGVALLYLRLETVRIQIATLRRPNSQRI